MLLLLVALGLMVVGGIMILVEAFRTSVGWGLACLFIPFVSLFFIVTHWQQCKKPFFLNLAGAGLVFVAVIVAGSGRHDRASVPAPDPTTHSAPSSGTE